MKNKNKYIIILIFLFMVSAIYGQKRTVEYLVSTYTIHAVPENTNMKALAGIDIATMRTTETKEYVEEIISNSNGLRTIITNTQFPEDQFDLRNSIAQTIIDEFGKVSFYNKEGEEIHYEDNTNVLTRRAVNPENSFSDEVVAQWGTYNNLFEGDIITLANQFVLENFHTTISGNQLNASLGNIEVLFDLDNLYTETRFFSRGILQFSYSTFYEDVNKHIIPFIEVHTTYDTLPYSEIRYQKSEIKTYQTYMIKELGRIILEVDRECANIRKSEMEVFQFTEMEQTNFDIKIYPNPASEQITIEFLSTIDEKVNIDIINTLGTIVLTRKGIMGNSLTLNISDLSEGTYIIRCHQGEITKAIKFIKH